MTTSSPWKYFSLDELKCKCGKCGSTGNEMDDKFMNHLVAAREALNFPFTITSAYRCPAYNETVSTTRGNAPHTTGRAIDIAIRGTQAYQLLQYATIHNGFTGIGISQKGISRFIHLDNLEPPNFPRPWIWSY